MFFSKFFLSKKKNQSENGAVSEWMKKQSHLDDALTYLIEKELFEHGQRDLSYVIPRKRNAAYFEDLLHRDSYEARFHSNMDLYESIAKVHPEGQQNATPPKAVTRSQSLKTVRPSVEPTDSLAKNTAPLMGATSNRSLSKVNKSNTIYNTTSSAVVVTAPEDQFEHDGVDMTCFED